ncbi:hypothetical protein BU17DRAFT_91842 [Hysterangium stoloniferum]|nr:hypothetical protein BU17DRAFT_91842 [Hysterangium stoloniferum]
MSFNATQSSGSACFLDLLQAEGPIRCPITPDMVASLNLDTFAAFFGAYCLNPPQGDHCPYGYCPNSEIAGLLVRLSAYATNFFVAILIYYEREELKDMFWVQFFGIYSLLLTSAWSIFRHQLTRIHAILTMATVGSPVTVYFFVYAVRSSLWKRKHHLEPVIGQKKRLNRGFVLLALFIWIGLNVYILLPSHLSDFQQEACEKHNRVVEHFLFLPVLIVVDLPRWAQCLAVLPFVLTVVTWITVILIKRRKIWPKGEAFTPLTFWGDIKKHYPFVQFITIVLIPTAYWIATIEVGVLKAGTRDNELSASFGQVRFLASFATFATFDNDEKTRAFLALEIGAGHSQLRQMTESITPTLRSLYQKEYYTEPRFHASIAWALLDPTSQTQLVSTPEVLADSDVELLSASQPSSDPTFITLPEFPRILFTFNDKLGDRLRALVFST